MKFYLLGTMLTRILMQLVLLTVFFIPISDVRAEPITFQFEGTLTSVDAPLQGTFSVGNSFEGSYTFDSDSPATSGDAPHAEYPNAITAMSFNSGTYLASAAGGSIIQDFEGFLNPDEPFYEVSFNPVVGNLAEYFVPSRIKLSWNIPGIGPPFPPPVFPLTVDPRFVPELPPFAIGSGSFTEYFDVNGNLIYSDSQILGDPNQPLFLFDGSPAPRIDNGIFSFSFLNSEGQVSTISGKLNSVTVVVNTDDGLIAHWPLDEGSGDIAGDISGNDNDGLIYGAVWQDEFLSFDGVDDFIGAGDFDVSGEELTLAGWVYSNQLKNCRARDCRIISKATGTAEQDHFWMLSTIKVGNQTRLRFRLKTDNGHKTSTLIASAGDLAEGELFHAAATYDGTTMRLYKNGMEVGSLAKTGSIVNHGEGIWIGGNPNVSTSRPWNGLIADVRIYKKALTNEELYEVIDELE